MIISHEYRFIFIKTAKTAGTSVEIALSRFCGDRDVITPISPEDEVIRRELGGRGPQHCVVPLWRYGAAEWKRLVRRRKRTRFYHHIPARDIRQYLGRRIWDGYYKFCFERNPWDRVVSLYHWICRTEPRPALAEFVKSAALLGLKGRGFGAYTIDGSVAVDRVCRYEALEEELESVRVHCGLPERLSLPRAKGSTRSDRRHFREILDPDSRDRIGSLFAEEIRLFGYAY